MCYTSVGRTLSPIHLGGLSLRCQQAAILNSLKLDTVHGCSFRVPVRRDMFNYLFCDRGRRVSR